MSIFYSLGNISFLMGLGMSAQAKHVKILCENTIFRACFELQPNAQIHFGSSQRKYNGNNPNIMIPSKLQDLGQCSWICGIVRMKLVNVGLLCRKISILVVIRFTKCCKLLRISTRMSPQLSKWLIKAGDNTFHYKIAFFALYFQTGCLGLKEVTPWRTRVYCSIFSDSSGLFTWTISCGKNLVDRGRKGVTKVGKSSFFSVVC